MGRAEEKETPRRNRDPDRERRESRRRANGSRNVRATSAATVRQTGRSLAVARSRTQRPRR